MTIIQRDRIVKIYNDNIAANSTDTKLIVAIPNGEQWHLENVIFADEGIGDNKSGAYSLEFGTTGSWTLVTGAWITGDTKHLVIDETFIGDGTNQFRIKRINRSANARNMIVVLKGFKRL